MALGFRKAVAIALGLVMINFFVIVNFFKINHIRQQLTLVKEEYISDFIKLLKNRVTCFDSSTKIITFKQPALALYLDFGAKMAEVSNTTVLINL